MFHATGFSVQARKSDSILTVKYTKETGFKINRIPNRIYALWEQNKARTDLS